MLASQILKFASDNENPFKKGKLDKTNNYLVLSLSQAIRLPRKSSALKSHTFFCVEALLLG